MKFYPHEEWNPTKIPWSCAFIKHKPSQEVDTLQPASTSRNQLAPLPSKDLYLFHPLEPVELEVLSSIYTLPATFRITCCPRTISPFWKCLCTQVTASAWLAQMFICRHRMNHPSTLIYLEKKCFKEICFEPWQATNIKNLLRGLFLIKHCVK